MKITAIKPLVVAEDRNFLYVVVETDEGVYGLGEAGITWREAAVVGFLEALAPGLIGQDPRRIEHLWQWMNRSGFFPASRIGNAAVSAIDIALWDIKAKSLGVPLYQLLGGQVRDRVAAYPNIRSPTAEGLADEARRRVDQGWRYVRFNLTEDLPVFEPRDAIREGVRRAAAVRDAIGDELGLIIDAHTRLDPADGFKLCRELAPLDPYFVEDPIRSENPESLARLAHRVDTPIAMGEQLASKWEFRPLIENEWIDFARLDLCIVGGITEAKKIAGWCETHYLPIAPHNPLGPVSTAACVHLDFATSNFAVQECHHPEGDWFGSLFPVQVPFKDGHFLPPDRPGLGVEIDLDAVAKHPPITGGACPDFRRADGTFTNW